MRCLGVIAVLAACGAPTPAPIATAPADPLTADPPTIDRDRFDHRVTGWPLDKGHRIACERCHPAANAPVPTFAGARVACGSCHAQPHAGMPYANRRCEVCHLTAESFAIITFDHDEKTTPIGASHHKVACATCHTPRLGTGAPPRACASCHASRDPHNGRFAPHACESCHRPSMSFTPGQPRPAWKPNGFDHRDAKWALTGRHAELACRACHWAPQTPVFAKLGTGTDCMGCHEHRKVHDAKYSNATCTRCHWP